MVVRVFSDDLPVSMRSIGSTGIGTCVTETYI
jgi:hypothetical protein